VRRSLLFSSAVHAALIAVIVFPGFQRTRPHMAKVINVSLVGEEKQKPRVEPKAVKPPQPPPTPEKKTEEPKMAYKAKTKTRQTDKEVKPAPEPKQPPVSRKESPPPQQTAKSGGPAKVEAPAGATSNVRVDDEDFRFAYYLEVIKERVSFNWSPPPLSRGDNVLCTVYFRIRRDGRISEIKVEQASGLDLFDKSALRAVNQSGPLPPLPAGFDGRWLGVHFEFQQTSE
jgi:protein TonB